MYRDEHGYLHVRAFLSRTGPQEYRNADGSPRIEYREAGEVFASESLATFDQAPFVVRHPGRIGPETYRAFVVGEVRSPRRNGDFVEAEILIRDEATIARVLGGELLELSCGYETTVVERGGRLYQTGIRINHVGAGPSGWGRAGAEVSLKKAA